MIGCNHTLEHGPMLVLNEELDHSGAIALKARLASAERARPPGDRESSQLELVFRPTRTRYRHGRSRALPLTPPQQSPPPRCPRMKPRRQASSSSRSTPASSTIRTAGGKPGRCSSRAHTWASTTAPTAGTLTQRSAAGGLWWTCAPLRAWDRWIGQAAILEPSPYKPRGGYSAGAPVAGPGSASRSSRREPMPSFVNTLPRCHSTVRGLRNNSAPICGFV
jgi:hypothetical protein